MYSEHCIMTEDGKVTFLVEHIPSVFNELVDQLHFENISRSESSICLPKIHLKDKAQNEYFRMMFAYCEIS